MAVKPKPKHLRVKKAIAKPRFPEKQSDLQFEIEKLIDNLLKARDPIEEFLPILRFFGSIMDKAIPEHMASVMMKRASFNITTYKDDPKYTVKASWQEKIYPDATPLYKAEVRHEILWIAVSVCYLRLCFQSNRKL